jgi:Fe-S cluster assembly ATP-binding protein
MLSVRNLTVAVEGKEILHGVSLDVRDGEVVALMGPNGSGKSTLAHALMGHPSYAVTGGSAAFDGTDLLSLAPEKRARLGLFLSFQSPQEISGVPLGKFLRTAYEEVKGVKVTPKEFFAKLDTALSLLKVNRTFAERPVNAGLSGGEKKRAEILQLAVLEPKLALLDETDSGLDVDALRAVAEGIRTLKERRPDMAVLLITHYERFLEFLTPNRVLVMKDGQIVADGTKELADRIQRDGYGAIGAG